MGRIFFNGVQVGSTMIERTIDTTMSKELEQNLQYIIDDLSIKYNINKDIIFDEIKKSWIVDGKVYTLR